MRSEEACGIAIPNPIPVLIVSSRCLSEARMLSRSSALIRPRLTSRSISSTMAGQRSVAFISGMICSADNRLANDMQFPIRERKLTVSPSDDKRDLGRCTGVLSRKLAAVYSALPFAVVRRMKPARIAVTFAWVGLIRSVCLSRERSMKIVSENSEETFPVGPLCRGPDPRSGIVRNRG